MHSEQSVKVAGIGVVFSRGRGVDCLEAALRQGWISPPTTEVSFPTRAPIPVYSLGRELLTDKAVLRNMRRADRFSKMAVLAAWDAVQDSGLQIAGGQDELGIILATAFGPHVTAFQFLDEIIEHGDAGASPTLFCHSLHNAATSYIASALTNRGPTITVTQFAFSFHQALILASAWIHEGRCQNVLVGIAEECGQVMNYICSQKLKIAEDGKIRAFAFSASPVAVPGEGSVFLLLTSSSTQKRYCDLTSVSFDREMMKQDPSLYLIEADGMATDERAYKEIADQDVAVAGYSPIFGSTLTGSAFHCASGALMLMNQTQYACPVLENPHGINLCTTTERRRLATIQCVRYGCVGERAVIELTR